jgi:hypothetical protein
VKLSSKLAAAGAVVGAALSATLMTTPAHAATYNVNLAVGRLGTGAALCLDADGSSGDIYNGDRVMLFPCDNTDYFQVWEMFDDGTIHSALRWDYCLDANWSPDGYHAGTHVTVYQCNYGANQKWYRTSSDGLLHNGADTNLVLDATGGTPVYRGQNVELWYKNGNDNQIWRES